MKLSHFYFFALTLGNLSLFACSGSSQATLGSGHSGAGQITVPGNLTISPGGSSPFSPPGAQRATVTDVLLFTGSGTWATEINSLEAIFSDHNTSYVEVSSAQLDSMSSDEIAQFGLMIFPGGSGETQASSLSAETHARLRAAVQQTGVNYLGFCAGAFIAVAPAPAPGQDVSYGLGVVDGPILDYYAYDDHGTGSDIAMTLESFPDGTTKDILWYGGPVTPSQPGQVLAKYPDNTAAMSQMSSGKGFVLLSGPHPTATQATLDALGVASSDGTHLDYAWTLIDSALHQNRLQAF